MLKLRSMKVMIVMWGKIHQTFSGIPSLSNTNLKKSVLFVLIQVPCLWLSVDITSMTSVFIVGSRTRLLAPTAIVKSKQRTFGGGVPDARKYWCRWSGTSWLRKSAERKNSLCSRLLSKTNYVIPVKMTSLHTQWAKNKKKAEARNKLSLDKSILFLFIEQKNIYGIRKSKPKKPSKTPEALNL